MKSVQCSVLSVQRRGLRTAPRSGVSLIEVLAAIGVISIGLLGLAALLPAGQFTIFEASKADIGGNCGRAAMHDIIVRRMLDPGGWSSSPGSGKSFLIDPLGVAAGLGPFGGVVPRISLAGGNAGAFTSTDDLTMALPEDMNPPQPYGRPTAVNTSGYFTWFASAVPAANNPMQFVVSAVVCYRRDFTEATATIPAANFYDLGIGGGSVLLTNPSAPFNCRENDWIALCGTNGGKLPSTICRWYRVATVGDDGVNLTLVGPDWDTSYATTAVLVNQSVVGVYTTTINLDTDQRWKN